MRVQRIVANFQTTDIAAAACFYRDVLGLEVLMDMGWIATYGSGTRTTPQISFASQGGAGTPTPDVSIEVDDVDAALSRAQDAGFAIEY
jgi:catechol 2,3-dioxygenase-like lactoylglutathione lyase family enzyme